MLWFAVGREHYSIGNGHFVQIGNGYSGSQNGLIGMLRGNENNNNTNNQNIKNEKGNVRWGRWKWGVRQTSVTADPFICQVLKSFDDKMTNNNNNNNSLADIQLHEETNTD